jgi:hypothetical protein
VHEGLGQHGGGGGSVARDVVGLLGDFLDQLGADALVRILKIDFLGDGDAIVGDGRCAIGLVEHHIAALRAQSDLHGVGELVETRKHALTSFLVVCNDLCHGCVSSKWLHGTESHLGARRGRRPSAAGCHSHSPSANWEISTLGARVPTYSRGLRCWLEIIA